MDALTALRAKIKEQERILRELLAQEEQLAGRVYVSKLKITKTKISKIKVPKKKKPPEEKPLSWKEKMNRQTIQKAIDVLAKGGKRVRDLSLREARDVLKVARIYRDFGGEGVGRLYERGGRKLNPNQKKVISRITPEKSGDLILDMADAEKKKRNEKKIKKAIEKPTPKGVYAIPVLEATEGSALLLENALEIAEKCGATHAINLLHSLESEAAKNWVSKAIVDNWESEFYFRNNPADDIENYILDAQDMAEGKDPSDPVRKRMTRYGAWKPDEIRMTKAALSGIRAEFEKFVRI